MEDFGVWDHEIVGAGVIETALVEVSKATTSEGWLISAENWGDLVAFDLGGICHG